MEEEPISQQDDTSSSFQHCIAMNLPLLNRKPQFCTLHSQRREEKRRDTV
jgi:hypothetical protein